MPGPDDDLLLGDDGDDDSTDDALSGDSSGKSNDPKAADKRISDLQSKADKETARANKAEATVKRLIEAAKDPDAEGSKPLAEAGGNAAFDAVLEMSKMFAIQQHPKLGEYGLSASDLTGSTPGEIAQSAAALVARFEKIETQARNKVLAANGLAPEVEAGDQKPHVARDFSKMSSEDFNKFLEAQMKGRL